MSFSLFQFHSGLIKRLLEKDIIPFTNAFQFHSGLIKSDAIEAVNNDWYASFNSILV